jgi:hypothetical protein
VRLYILFHTRTSTQILGVKLTRHAMLPPDAKNARRLCRERFKELAALTAGILRNPLPNPVKAGCLHLQEMADTFDAPVKIVTKFSRAKI